MIDISKRKYVYLGSIIAVILLVAVIMFPKDKKQEVSTNKLTATVISTSSSTLTVQDENDIIYTFNTKNQNAKVGENVVIEYTGLLDKNTELQKGALINILPVSNDGGLFTNRMRSGGIFDQYSTLATEKLKQMTLDEKIGQLFLVHYPNTTSEAKKILENYKIGGFLFFERDFKDKTEKEVQNMINEAQRNANIPLLTAVDEEGGKVVRVSSNQNLVKEKFSSPRELYQKGGFNLIKEDTIEKSNILNKLGLNVNLAPVVDVSTNSSDYMYDRTLGENTDITSTYAKTVVEASKGTGVSYVLKHFPGYGNNKDTHQGTVTDNRTYSDIETNDLPPFEAGIESNAEAILVSHNTVVNIDSNNPASLSPSIHNLLRNNLNFTGVIITDDLTMGAVSSIDNANIKALLAGNDIIITSKYEEGIREIKTALQDGTISEDLIDNAVYRILAWKYYKGIMFNQK